MTHKDPVCGMEVDESTEYQSTHEGRNHYFCSEDCQEKFDEMPQQYAGIAGSREVH